MIPNSNTQPKPLRLWPGVLIVAIQWLLRFVVPAIEPKAMTYCVIGGVLCGLAIPVWWIFFSRASRFEKWVAFFLVKIALITTSFFLDKSIATAMMGLMFIIYSIPVMSMAFVIWAVVTQNLSITMRRVTMIITIVLASGMWLCLRTNGMDGDEHQDLAWRWSTTREDQFLKQAVSESTESPSATAESDLKSEWPGFRGLNRDGVVKGVQIKTEWSVSPPVEMWRRKVGPGCSSFAVRGNLLYTQEQRGEFDIVSCYNLSDGKPVWKHQDKDRFYDSHAGPGPRSTPLLAGSRVYSLGGTGILNALDARDGSVKWSRNAASDADVKVLPWGFAGSPLVVSDVIIVAVAGKLAAYDTVSGNPRWFGTNGGSSYSSPQLFTINGVPQTIFMSDSGAVSVDPASGKKLWDYPWKVMGRILQPSIIENGDLMLSSENSSIRRITVSQTNGEWKTKDIWTNTQIKAYFNDFVIHKGYAYGFDGPSIVCIDLKDGKRTWRGDRYRGFILLVEDQDILIILTEKGELALVQADPKQFRELSRIRAIKGKTWNHPVLAGNILVVRNASEMAAFRLNQK